VRNRSRAVFALIVAVALAANGEAATYEVKVTVTGLRSAKGQVLACLTAQPSGFPDCTGDPEAHHLTIPAGVDVTLDFRAVPPGVYAVSVVHDENGNGKLDKRLMLPREGYGFSRDAPVRFGPPRFAAAAFAVTGDVVQTLKLRYIF
jgi:uncharacterized protein (DUF2141 family)